jgi:hypothetical protein
MATIVKHRWFSMFAFSGDESVTGTFTLNTAPAFIVAQTSLFRVYGREMVKIGIAGFRHRPEPDGPEEEVDFGGFGQWRGTIGHDRVTSITFGVWAGSEGDQLEGHANLYWWG